MAQVLKKDISTFVRRPKRTPFGKSVLNEISHKINLNRTTWLKFHAVKFVIVNTYFTSPWSSGQRRFVWSKTDTLTTTTNTSQLIIMSAHWTLSAKALDFKKSLVMNLLKWPWSVSHCECVGFEKSRLSKSFMTPHFFARACAIKTHRSCCSGHWLFLIYDLFAESAPQNGSLWKEKVFLIAEV